MREIVWSILEGYFQFMGEDVKTDANDSPALKKLEKSCRELLKFIKAARG